MGASQDVGKSAKEHQKINLPCNDCITYALCRDRFIDRLISISLFGYREAIWISYRDTARLVDCQKVLVETSHLLLNLPSEKLKERQWQVVEEIMRTFDLKLDIEKGVF